MIRIDAPFGSAPDAKFNRALSKRRKGGGFIRTFARAFLCIAPMLMVQMVDAAETVTYYYSDNQGTVLATANASGALTSTSDYRPYGTQTLGSPTAGPGYTGHVNDVDSSLVYMQARYYDPEIGRFLGRDPVAASPADAFSFNRYSYVNNNPLKYTDPSGRCIWDACVAEGYVAVVLIAAGAAYVTHQILVNMRDHPVATSPVATKNESAPTNTITTDEAKGKVFEGTTPAAGKSGVKGEREGEPGGETAAWDKIDGKETAYNNGTKVKELGDGGHADLHSSTKSPDYPQGTQTIKIRNSSGEVVGTVRYPAPPPPPPQQP